MTNVLQPGTFCCVDECMPAWKGLSADVAGRYGMPHVTKIQRKPEGVGVEMKSIADAQTGIIFRLDIEGREREHRKPYSDRGAGVAQCLRFTIGIHGTGRIVVADSAFASVKTCIELAKVGLFSRNSDDRL